MRQEHSWFASYHIQATGPDTGLIETITSAQDLDRLKKAPGYTTLRALFESRYGAPDGAPFKEAQARFSKSLAAYSILMWILLLRDRHNANLMLDDEGRYFHVDFGFVLGHSTGKGIGGMVENSAFKLTNEYIEVRAISTASPPPLLHIATARLHRTALPLRCISPVPRQVLDGLGSDAYNAFCTSCVENLRAARAHGETICTLVEIVGTNSVFPCFQVPPPPSAHPPADPVLTRC